MEIDRNSEQKQSANSEYKHKRRAWTNDDRIEILRLRLQGLTFEDIGQRMNRTKLLSGLSMDASDAVK